jgi:site-specific DNA recombinase
MSPKKVTIPLDIYVRVSDTRGRSGESFISPDEQEDRCRNLIRARRFKVGEVFTDLDVSGDKMRRPELDKAIARIADGTSGGIVVARIDRFSRTLVGGLQTLEEINALGGVVIVADGEFDTSTATGELVLNMMLSLAQFELRRISENWGSAKKRAVERGVHITRFAPPGYRRREDGRLEPHPKHKRAVTEAFRLAANGETYVAVAHHLTAKKVPSVDTEEPTWQPHRMKRLLANRVYLGEARNGHGDVNPDAHTPLVDEVTWNLAQRGPTVKGLSARTGSLLAGLCRCAACSFAMRGRHRETRAATYRCQTFTMHGRCPQSVTVTQEKVDEYVLEQFLARADNIYLSPVEADDSDIGAEIVEAEASYRAALTDMALRRRIGDADHAILVAAAKDEWERLLTAAPAPQLIGAKGVNWSELVAELRAEGNVRDLRELLAPAIQAVFVRPASSRRRDAPIEDRVHIVWADDEELELPKRGEAFTPRPYVW